MNYLPMALEYLFIFKYLYEYLFIFIYFYTNELRYVKYEALKEEINIEILKILKEEEVELMFLNLNFGMDSLHKDNNCEATCSELESIRNITEEERGNK